MPFFGRWILPTFAVLAFWVALSTCKIWGSAQNENNKDNRCRMLKNYGCNASLYRILDFEEAGWFFHAPFKSCRPFYGPPNRVMCPENLDLPRSKEKCEELCGARCVLPDGKKGTCMMEGSCDVQYPASYHPRPCGSYNVQCCPKSRSTKKPR